jgi:hypothetical protein
MDHVRPFGPVKVRQGNMHEQIPHRRGIEHACVIDDCEMTQC